MTQVVKLLPIRTESETNGSHGNHFARARRTKQQRHAVALLLRAPLRGFQLGDGVTVTLTRQTPSGPGLDPHDNLPSSQKHVVDEIASMLGLRDDRDPRVTWRYEQRRGPWGVEVRIEARVSQVG